MNNPDVIKSPTTPAMSTPSSGSTASDSELLDWMQSTKWIIEINDSNMGIHVVKKGHLKYFAPTLREAISEAMRDKP